jgi:hypothetical protein
LASNVRPNILKWSNLSEEIPGSEIRTSLQNSCSFCDLCLHAQDWPSLDDDFCLQLK